MSIFVQEVHLLEICFNSYEKSEYLLHLKNEKHLYMSHSE